MRDHRGHAVPGRAQGPLKKLLFPLFAAAILVPFALSVFVTVRALRRPPDLPKIEKRLRGAMFPEAILQNLEKGDVLTPEQKARLAVIAAELDRKRPQPYLAWYAATYSTPTVIRTVTDKP